MPRRTVPHRVIDNPIHLFRALLRECTYLPDPASRPLLARYVSSRFRELHPSPAEGRPRPRPLTPKDRVQAIYKARRAVSLLFRANHGERSSLTKVLMFTYARLGRPRRELVRQLQLATIPSVNALPSKKDFPAPRNLEGWPHISSKVEVLAASQMQHQPPTSRAPIKVLTPTIGLNTWGRRMPKCREKNMRWKHYRHILDNLLPPLPEKEWCRLRDLSYGTRPWDGPVARRAGSQHTEEASTLLTPNFLETQLGRWKHQITFRGLRQSLTSRSMRRLWADIFAQCPVMRWDRAQRTWQVEWGRHPTVGKDVGTPTNDVQMQFFGGVDSNGNLPGQEVKHQKPPKKPPSLDLSRRGHETGARPSRISRESASNHNMSPST